MKPPRMGDRPCQDPKLFHHYKDTGLYGAWVRTPATRPRRFDRPRRLGIRVFLGSFSTFNMAARMQDRAIRKIKPSGPYNFKASDYDEDKELRRNLNIDQFLVMLRTEGHRKYKVVAKSDCYLKFARMLEEEITLAEQELKVTHPRKKKLKHARKKTTKNAGKKTIKCYARKKAIKHAREENTITALPPPTTEVTEAALSLLAIFQTEDLANSSVVFKAKRAPISRNGADGAEGSGQITNKPVTRSAKKKELATSSTSSVTCSLKETECDTTRSVKRRRS